MKLKFEKVYLPCILQTKKRYVGYMYETKDQAEPVYDAKGIETVRRDGIPAVVKVSNTPTEQFPNLEPQNPPIFVSELLKIFVNQKCLVGYLRQ